MPYQIAESVMGHPFRTVMSRKCYDFSKSKALLQCVLTAETLEK